MEWQLVSTLMLTWLISWEVRRWCNNRSLLMMFQWFKIKTCKNWLVSSKTRIRVELTYQLSSWQTKATFQTATIQLTSVGQINLMLLLSNSGRMIRQQSKICDSAFKWWNKALWSQLSIKLTMSALHKTTVAMAPWSSRRTNTNSKVTLRLKKWFTCWKLKTRHLERKLMRQEAEWKI